MGTREPIEREIEKINAYTKLLKKFIGIGGASEEVEAEVNAEFHAWVQDKILELMGKRNDKDTHVVATHTMDLSDEEIKILKVFLAQLKARQAAQPATQAAQPLVNKPAPSPLKPGLDTKAYNDQQKRILDEVRLLEQMEREGPEF